MKYKKAIEREKHAIKGSEQYKQRLERYHREETNEHQKAIYKKRLTEAAADLEEYKKRYKKLLELQEAEEVRKDLNYNYKKMDQLIKKQLELFKPDGAITEKNKKIFFELEKELNLLEKELKKQFKNLKIARHKESGKICKAFNCQYSIAAVQVENKKMSWTKFFNDYIAL